MGEITDKLKGKGKQVQGKATGNRARVAEGKAQEAMGEIEGAANRVQRKVKSGVDRAKQRMSERKPSSKQR